VLRPSPSSTRAAAITPAEPVGARVARFPTAGSLPRHMVGSASASLVSRPAQRSLALQPVWSPNRPRRPFVVGVLRPMSLPPSSAPTATGWSDSCRAGFAPAEEQRLVTAHHTAALLDPVTAGSSRCRPRRRVARPRRSRRSQARIQVVRRPGRTGPASGAPRGWSRGSGRCPHVAVMPSASATGWAVPAVIRSAAGRPGAYGPDRGRPVRVSVFPSLATPACPCPGSRFAGA